MVLEVFWNVLEGVSKNSVRLGSSICRSSSVDVVLQDECSRASSRRMVELSREYSRVEVDVISVFTAVEGQADPLSRAALLV